jgi:hypothetical protein
MTGSTPQVSRTLFWYVKFVFACYGAGVGAAIMLSALSMPFGLLPWLLGRQSGVMPLGAAVFLFAIGFAPLIWMRLR